MSRRRIAHAERRIETAHNHSNTRRWTIAVQVMPAYEGPTGLPKFLLVPRGADISTPAVQRIATSCSVRFARAKRKARKLGLVLHAVKAVKVTK